MIIWTGYSGPKHLYKLLTRIISEIGIVLSFFAVMYGISFFKYGTSVQDIISALVFVLFLLFIYAIIRLCLQWKEKYTLHDKKIVIGLLFINYPILLMNIEKVEIEQFNNDETLDVIIYHRKDAKFDDLEEKHLAGIPKHVFDYLQLNKKMCL